MSATVDFSAAASALRLPRRPLRIVLGAGALAVALLVVQALAAPAPADAFLGLPDPAEIVRDGVKSSFDFVIKQLFGGVPTKLTEAAITWQLHLPSEAFTNSNLAQLNRTTTTAAFALLTLAMTAAVLRYWLTGFVEGTGGAEAIGGFVRGIAAGLALVAWPWTFNAAVALVNSLTFALIHARSVHDDVSRILGAAVGISLAGGPLGMLASIAIVVAGTLLMLALFAMHIVLAGGLGVMFVAGPLLIAASPFPGTAWMSAFAFRAWTTLLAWPVIWAVCFAAFAALFSDLAGFRGDGGVLDKALVKPLTGVAMLYLCVKLPIVATKASMVGVGGIGTVGFAARYFAVRQAGTHLFGGVDAGTSATPRHRGAAAPDAVLARGASVARPGSAVASTSSIGVRSASDPPPARDMGPDRATQDQVADDRSSGADGSQSRRTSPISSPVSLQSLGARPRELADEMERARRRAGGPGAPPAATEGDVAEALHAIGPRRAAAIGNVYERAITTGRNREDAVAAVTRASAVGAARAEANRAPDDVRAYRTLGSAPPHALAGGLDAYRIERGPDPAPSPKSGAPQAIDAPAVALPRPSTTDRRPGGVS